jgi:glycolate oxidase iron-sulfur subunit
VLLCGAAIKRFARHLPRQLAPLIAHIPETIPAVPATDRAQVFAASRERRMRVALLPGCAQRVLAPDINDATIRLLTRHGCEVVVTKGSGCCGALSHHLGQEAAALRFARANIDSWERERLASRLDAVVINASGCGTTVKDYGFMLREDPDYAEKAARIAALARDVTEVAESLGVSNTAPVVTAPNRRVAYHSACSMQHGQRLHRGPTALLTAAGFETIEVPEGHLCCGSAGTYNLLQPEIAGKLRQRKLANIGRIHPDIVATGNIGCIVQLTSAGGAPVVHTVELLDWASGGPEPEALRAGYSIRRLATAGISNESASAAAPMADGVTQPASPKASCSPAAPKSTQAIVIGS